MFAFVAYRGSFRWMGIFPIQDILFFFFLIKVKAEAKTKLQGKGSLAFMNVSAIICLILYFKNIFILF
jgi:hypothetical protein